MHGDELYLFTTLDAPNGMLYAVDLTDPPDGIPLPLATARYVRVRFRFRSLTPDPGPAGNGVGWIIDDLSLEWLVSSWV